MVADGNSTEEADGARSASRHGSLAVSVARCTTCGYCEVLCPEDAVTLKHVAQIDDSACSQCGLCIESCPVGALTWPQTES